ncbi:MAG: conserved repeat domain protein [Planctomycetaceae bacterium]|nr:conserved repeat domain protein [Planctomycetaceae bacterium]
MRGVWKNWNKRLLSLSALGLCGFCSCAALDRPQPADTATSVLVPDQPRMQAIVQSQMTVRSQSEESSPFETSEQPATPRRRPAGRARLQNSVPSATLAQQAGRQSAGIQQMGGENVRQVSKTDRAVERIAASARTPANAVDLFAAGPVFDDDGPSAIKYPDEYIFDGGDRAFPLTRNNDVFLGVETEDTIAEYKDHEDKPRVKKSNRVAIYSPRFGSVVTISSPNSDTIVDKVSGHMVAQGGFGMRSRQSIDEKRQNLEPIRVQTRSRATGIGTEVGTNALSKEVNREVGVAVMKMHQSRGQWGKGEFQENLKASSAQGRLFAEHWTRKDFPVLEGHASAATQTVTLQVTAEYVGLEDNGKRGDLLLTKTANRGEANIGDLITFTIHFENRGDKELRSVVIIDNLSPRLEFEAGSVTTDRPGKHTAHDNDEGSVVLKFTLDEPLPGRTKGSITFQCKVK